MKSYIYCMYMYVYKLTSLPGSKVKYFIHAHIMIAVFNGLRKFIYKMNCQRSICGINY